jgi:acetyl esterase/lipase
MIGTYKNEKGEKALSHMFNHKPATTLMKMLAAGLALSLSSAVQAQASEEQMVPIAIPAMPNEILLKTGELPGATAQESWHRQYHRVFARNVTQATLTPFLADPAKATGAAVIVAPGGGFRTLSMENEGWDVAKALAEKGVSAFVLKYRLVQTPADIPAFERSMAEMFSGVAQPRKRPSPDDSKQELAPQITDARAAFALVRSRATEWKVDPDRIGMLGFSAGAMLTIATTLHGEEAKPAFIGNIYGPLSELTVPENAPPLFVGLAADDPFFANAGYALIDNWRAAKRPVEFHLYEQGGHGFGMYQKTTTSTGWFPDYVRWLQMRDFAGQ